MWNSPGFMLQCKPRLGPGFLEVWPKFMNYSDEPRLPFVQISASFHTDWGQVSHDSGAIQHFRWKVAKKKWSHFPLDFALYWRNLDWINNAGQIFMGEKLNVLGSIWKREWGPTRLPNFSQILNLETRQVIFSALRIL